MAGWPVAFNDEIDAGTIYVSPTRLPGIIEKHGHRGQAWRMGYEYASYVPSQRIVYKSTKRLALTSETEFWSLMGRCESRNLKPPASYSDLFFQHYRVPRLPVKTFLAPFQGFTFGGWQAAIWPGGFSGHVRHYDINSAYRWAACTGLPDMETGRRTMRFNDPIAVYLVELDANTLEYAPWSGVHMVTSEERDFFKLTPRRVLHGVRFDSMHDMSAAFAGLDNTWPRDTVKRMARAFWGKFNTPTGPMQCTWKVGPKETPHKNHLFNPIWSAFITSRVKLRLANFRPRALHYFVDSILSTEELPTGDQCGDFKLVGEYPMGVYVKAPGWWAEGPTAPRRGSWTKHAGVKYTDVCVN